VARPGAPSGRLEAVQATTLDGKATAAAIRAELTERVTALAEAGHRPGLGTLLVGDDPGSRWYVDAKHSDCAQVGIASIQRELPATATLADVLAVVEELNADPACTGYIVQLPLPRQVDEYAVLEAMDPAEDVRAADVVVAAAGVPGLISADIVKPGAAVLDVGVSRVDGKIAGDVARDVVYVAGFVAPNPGGVGPMTRAMLLQNVVLAAEQAAAPDVLTAP